jgi:chromosome segregation ATPase
MNQPQTQTDEFAPTQIDGSTITPTNPLLQVCLEYRARLDEETNEVARLTKRMQEAETLIKRGHDGWKKAEAEVARLNNTLENTRISRDTMIEDRNLLDQELAASKAEVERLRSQLNRAVEIAERFQQVEGEERNQCNCPSCQMLAELKKEIK